MIIPIVVTHTFNGIEQKQVPYIAVNVTSFIVARKETSKRYDVSVTVVVYKCASFLLPRGEEFSRQGDLEKGMYLLQKIQTRFS